MSIELRQPMWPRNGQLCVGYAQVGGGKEMNDKALKLLAKPYFDWIVEEQKRLPELLQTILDSGVHLIILGKERCFFCGVPIDNQIAEVKKITQNIGQNG